MQQILYSFEESIKESKQLFARRRNIRKRALTLIRGKQSGLKWLGVTEVLNVAVESPGSWVCVCSKSVALGVLIYRVGILSDSCRLLLPASTALHVWAVG